MPPTKPTPALPLRNRIVGAGLEAPDQLLSNPRNWRLHPKEQQDALEGVLETVGWTQQVVVNRTTGFMVDGHLRVALALRRGESEIPVSYVELSEAEEALILATFDPIGAMAVTDEKLLDELVAEIRTDDARVEALLASLVDTRNAPPVDPEVLDEAPPLPAEPTSKRGDLYQLGHHRLLCGDATDPAALERLMAGATADMLLTDPPYDVAYVGKTADQLQIQNDALGFEGTLALLRASLGLAAAHVREGGGIYVFAPHGPQFLPFAIVGAEMGWWRQTIVWVKDAFALGRSDYHYKHEAILAGDAGVTLESVAVDAVPREADPIGYGWVPGAKHAWAGDRKQSTAWEFPRPKRSTEHPTMKPVALLERALRNSTARGGSVLDCFARSGSTLIAAEATGRRCFALEVDPRYIDVILARFERITGQVPKQIIGDVS